MTTIIPWLNHNSYFHKRFFDAFQERGIEVKPICYHHEAFGIFRTQKAPVLLTSIYTNPGNTENIRTLEIINQENSSQEYWEVGLRLLKYLITKTQEPLSVNRNTPIVVIDSFNDEKDFQVGNTLERCFEAGATEFLSTRKLSPRAIAYLVGTYL